MSATAENRLILVIDSDEPHRARLTALLREQGYDVQSVPHEGALSVLREGHPFGALILCSAPEPSTLSPQDRLGEFVALQPRPLLHGEARLAQRPQPALAHVVRDEYFDVRHWEESRR